MGAIVCCDDNARKGDNKLVHEDNKSSVKEEDSINNNEDPYFESRSRNETDGVGYDKDDAIKYLLDEWQLKTKVNYSIFKLTVDWG